MLSAIGVPYSLLYLSYIAPPFRLNMLVYRILRALSDRALDFYSEVHVEGQHNIPAEGPIIVYVWFAAASER